MTSVLKFKIFVGQKETRMAEGVNVRFPAKLRDFVEERADGYYSSASEYIRALVRRDYEAEEAKRFGMLRSELTAGMEADAEVFIPVSVDDVIRRNRS